MKSLLLILCFVVSVPASVTIYGTVTGRGCVNSKECKEPEYEDLKACSIIVTDKSGTVLKTTKLTTSLTYSLTFELPKDKTVKLSAICEGWKISFYNSLLTLANNTRSEQWGGAEKD